MICVICHGTEIQLEDVRQEIQLGSDLVYVRVRVPVCQTCGERYYGRNTMRHLEVVEHELREGNGRLKEVGRVLVYE